MAKKNKYADWTKEELIKRVTALDKRKKYGLVWDEEKTKEKFEADAEGKFPVLKEVKTKEIKTDPKQPTHILIEGDNYHALSVLSYTHEKKIDVIYIDPPYNTGNNDFKYNDIFVDKDDSYRHSKWLSFMSKRLKLSKILLSENGIIYISIDDNEQAQLKLLCDEIFGESNFVTTIHVQMSTVSGQKVRAAKDGNIVKNAEYVLVYCKNGKKNIGKNLLYEPVEYDTHYSIFLTKITEGLWKESSFISECINNGEIFSVLLSSGLAKIKNNKKIFTIKNLAKAYSSIEKFRNFVHQNSDRIVRTDRMIEADNDLLEKNIKPNHTYTYLHKNGKKYLYGIDKNGEMKQRFLLSDKVREADDFYKTFGITNLRGDWWPGFHLDMGNVPKEGGIDFLNGKKPVRLIKQLINFRLDKSGVILDFFAGSGTTGHAALEINYERKFLHQFILCTNNENNICREKTLPRIKNAINGYSNKIGLKGNLKYFKTSFVPQEPTDKNKGLLTKEATEMLCLRENAFEFDIEKEGYKIYKNDKKYLGIILDQSAIEEFKKEAKKYDKPINVYVFSLTDEDFSEEFSDLKKKVKVCSIPEAILRVYRRIFK